MEEPADNRIIAAAARILAAGGVVCVPTESSYGLAADIRCPHACARIAAIKARPGGAPFPVIAGDLAQARGLAARWPRAASDLAARHWPGPLTLVVPARAGLPAECIGADGTIGVRVSSHPWARALALSLGAPFTATSANRSGEPPASTIAVARSALGDAAVDLYIDAGELAGGPPSTVVGVGDDGVLTVFRAGAVRLESGD